MKKLVFTALAVVAFSGVAMAGGLSNKKNKKMVGFDCCKYYNLVYDYMIENGASPMEAGNEANLFENNCEARQR